MYYCVLSKTFNFFFFCVFVTHGWHSSFYSPAKHIKPMTIVWRRMWICSLSHKFAISVILAHSKSRSSSVCLLNISQKYSKQQAILHVASSFEFDLDVIHPILCIWWFHLSILFFIRMHRCHWLEIKSLFRMSKMLHLLKSRIFYLDKSRKTEGLLQPLCHVHKRRRCHFMCVGLGFY